MVTLIFAKLFVLLLLLDYDVFAVLNRKSNKESSSSRSKIQQPLPHNHQPNLTIYLGYANNLFGPTNNMQNSTSRSNSTSSKGKSSKHYAPFSDIDEPRSKRGVIHLYNMVSCATGCNPLIFKGYGCYCGFLGSGYPVDGIDRCCRNHDWCYDIANCPMYLQYFVPYYWKCYHNTPLCAIDHGEFGGPGSCAQRLCECDRVLSECLSRYPCPSSRALCRSSPWRLIQNTIMIF